jgi:protein TonB
MHESSLSVAAGDITPARRMRTAITSVLLILVFLAPLQASPEPKTAREAFDRHLIVYSVSPRYPSDLQRRRIKGSGVFEMKYDYDTGRVREVLIVQSTGNDILDRNAVLALRRWRVKPHSVHTLRLPVTFGG